MASPAAKSGSHHSFHVDYVIQYSYADRGEEPGWDVPRIKIVY